MNVTYESRFSGSAYPVYYTAEPRRSARRVAKRARRLERFFRAVSELPLRKLLKGCAMVGCLFAFLGVISGVETEVLSLGVGILLSALLLFCELLCLKS